MCWEERGSGMDCKNRPPAQRAVSQPSPPPRQPPPPLPPGPRTNKMGRAGLGAREHEGWEGMKGDRLGLLLSGRPRSRGRRLGSRRRRRLEGLAQKG